ATVLLRGTTVAPPRAIVLLRGPAVAPSGAAVGRGPVWSAGLRTTPRPRPAAPAPARRRIGATGAARGRPCARRRGSGRRPPAAGRYRARRAAPRPRRGCWAPSRT